MPSATSQRLRLDLKCGVFLGAEMFRTISPVKPALDRSWQRVGRTTRMAALTTPAEAPVTKQQGPDRRDLKYQEVEAAATDRLASLPELARAHA